MFNANCPICLEELDAHNTPVAMPCGHMYCLDCATFWFNQSDGPQKCPCGRAFKGDEIIKLWTGTGNSQAPIASSSTPRREGTAQGQAALAACNTALQECEPWGQSNALSSALSQTQLYLDSISTRDVDVGTQNILKSLRSVLWEIKSHLTRPQTVETAADSDDRLRSAHKELRHLKAKMARDIQGIYKQSLVQEESARTEIAKHEAHEEELQQKLQDTRRALDTVRRHLENSRLNETALGEEVEHLRKGELRYRKKYYALKQEVQAIKRSASGKDKDYEDDSLLVI